VIVTRGLGRGGSQVLVAAGLGRRIRVGPTPTQTLNFGGGGGPGGGRRRREYVGVDRTDSTIKRMRAEEALLLGKWYLL